MKKILFFIVVAIIVTSCVNNNLKTMREEFISEFERPATNKEIGVKCFFSDKDNALVIKILEHRKSTLTAKDFSSAILNMEQTTKNTIKSLGVNYLIIKVNGTQKKIRI